MKFRRVNLSILRNEEWFNFFREFKKFVEERSPQALNIEKLFLVFLVLYSKADEVMETIRKSGITIQISDLDKKRDDTFRGLITVITSYKHHFESTKRDDFNSLSPVLSHYGNLAKKPYNEKTAGIYNFIQELRENYNDIIKTLDLVDWLEELERNNQAFENAILERNRRNANKTELHLLDIRKETIQCYKNIIERLEAIMRIEEEDGTENADRISFVKTLNTNLKRYVDILAQRKGRNADDNEYDEES
jgi:hypothetical protein